MAAHSPGLAGIRILARLELAQAARVLALAWRDPVLLAGVAALAAALAISLHGLAAVALVRPLAAAAGLAGLWALAALALMTLGARGHVGRLRAGPFQPLAADQRVLTRWLGLRTLGWTAAAAAIVALAVSPAGWLAAALVLVSAAVGAAAGVLAATALRLARSSGPPHRAAPAAIPQRAPQRCLPRLRRPAALIAWAHWRRGAGSAPHWVLGALCVGLAAAAGALATRNSGPDVGAAVLAVVCLPGLALAADVDQPLLRLLGREPVSMARLVTIWCAPTLVAVGLAMVPVGLLAGLGPTRALAVALLLALAAALGRLTLLLHGLTRSQRAAPLAASLDGAIALVIFCVLSWGLIAAPLRLALLARRAARLRWLAR